ncbi:MAG: PIN domain-containing protein [Acidobacteria bacterium]|nr:PIN domain-containing protein [Acidobacteriota bacterium]
MSVFVDTSAFAALENRRDARHEAAVREYRRLIRARASFLTSDYVFDETLTLLKARAGSQVALRWGERMLASSLFDLLVVDRPMLEKALGVFGSTLDQPFSFTDCASFALMRAHGIGDALAFDDDFVRFGFRALPERRRR